MVEYYCYQQSWGTCTNLQLFALLQAWRYWKELDQECSHGNVRNENERCVVIIVLLGTSLYQLLGQNYPDNSNKKRLPSGRDLLEGVLTNHAIPDELRSDLLDQFADFNEDYNACRHFGHSKYHAIAAISVERTRAHVIFSLMIWRTVCKLCGVDFEDIEDFLNEVNKYGDSYGPRDH